MCAHFEEATAAHVAAGRSREAAELEALDELGRPEVVAAAFRHEQRTLRRFAGGPGALALDLTRSWRALALSALLAASLGALAARALPPTYEVRVPLRMVFKLDFGAGIAASQVLDVLAGGLPLTMSGGQPTVDVRDHDEQAALNRAEAAADVVTNRFPGMFRITPYSGGSEEATVQAGPPSIVMHYPVAPATAGGLGLGLLTGGALALRRRRR